MHSFERSRGITADGMVAAPRPWGQLYAQPGTGGARRGPIPSPAADRWALPADVRAAGEAQSVRYDFRLHVGRRRQLYPVVAGRQSASTSSPTSGESPQSAGTRAVKTRPT